MPATLLPTRRVAKPWGRHTLWPGFDDPDPADEPIGEIWFPSPADDDPELLIKYLFTSERLSVQVHPDDEAAWASGYPRGKDEAWLVLAAEPGATIALGPKASITAAQLRAAALDGSIVDLLDWRPVAAGDFIYSPAGTIHALSAGLTVIEIQQNLDLTYRLYDYGRPRALQLDEGVAVASLTPFGETPAPASPWLADGAKFSVRLLQAGKHQAQAPGPQWLVPIAGSGRVDGRDLRAGECWQLAGEVSIELHDASTALLAAAC